jgi:hypothetical protein
MENDTDKSDDSVDRLLSEYAEVHLLLDADPRVLHEAIFSCEPEQLENIMEIIEDQLTNYMYHGPNDLPTAQQFLSVWFIALRAWDSKASCEGDSKVTELNFQTLKYDQHFD